MADRDVKLRLLIQAVDRAGKTLNEVSQKLGGISNKTEKANADAKRLGAEGARALNKYAEAAKKAETRMTALREASSAMVGVGMQLAAAGAALSGLALFPIAKAASFEKAMSGVEAVTTGATESFEEMASKARELGRSTKFTATEAAEGMKLLGMAGLTAQQAIEGLGPALQLAAAGGLGLAEAADIATNVMSGFALDAKDVAHIADVLANSASSANTTVTELGEAMSYVAPLSRAAGISMDETAAILSTLGDNGIKASRAGTSLRGMLIALAAPTKQSEDTFAKLGVEIAKLNDGSIDVVTTLERLEEANFNVADATNIFRRTAAAAALAAASSTDKIRRLRKWQIP
jgi:TP901 family phage tail tape measure protein